MRVESILIDCARRGDGKKEREKKKKRRRKEVEKRGASFETMKEENKRKNIDDEISREKNAY